MIDEMSQDVAPRLDEFGATFYNHFYDIVGEDLCTAIDDIFKMGYFSMSWKVENPKFLLNLD